MYENLKKRQSKKSHNPPPAESPPEISSPEVESLPLRRGGHNLLENCRLFPNRMKEKFHEEVIEANQAIGDTEYENGPGPYVQGTKGFSLFIDRQSLNQKFKWTYDETNGLVVIAPHLKHSVAAGGAEVITAGHARLTGEGQILIDNDTGHYHTTFESLDLVLSSWRKAGYTVQKEERVDFAAALNALGGQQNPCAIM